MVEQSGGDVLATTLRSGKGPRLLPSSDLGWNPSTAFFTTGALSNALPLSGTHFLHL